MSCISQGVFAEESDSYQVEILLFKHNESNAEPERSNDALTEKISTAIQLQNNEDETPIPPFTLLPKKALKLKREDYVLRKREAYRVLLHIAWKQQFNSPRQAQNIHIYAQAIGDPHSIYSLPPYNKQLPWTVDGVISLSQNNYINLSTHLLFNLGIGEAIDEDDDSTARYLMKQKRRIRPKEVHYIDHPNFGMLIAVYPVTVQQKDKPTPE